MLQHCSSLSVLHSELRELQRMSSVAFKGNIFIRIIRRLHNAHTQRNGKMHEICRLTWLIALADTFACDHTAWNSCVCTSFSRFVFFLWKSSGKSLAFFSLFVNIIELCYSIFFLKRKSNHFFPLAKNNNHIYTCQMCWKKKSIKTKRLGSNHKSHILTQK